MMRGGMRDNHRTRTDGRRVIQDRRQRRLCDSIGQGPPAEYERVYYRLKESYAVAA
jgi:hypothetical protein